jgi:serine/threonine-protein kinase
MRMHSKRIVSIIIAVTLIIVIIVLWRKLKHYSALTQVVRFNITIPPNHMKTFFAPIVTFSPDGKRLVYVAGRGDKTQLYLRELDSFETKPISGTKNGYGPFFSPDGQWIGFFTDSEIKKVLLEGGNPVSLHKYSQYVSGYASWDFDNKIYFDNHKNILSIPFDMEQQKVTGPSVPVADQVMVETNTGSAQFSMSENGSLVYIKNEPELRNRSLLWVDHRGQSKPITERMHPYRAPRLSPIGNQLAVTREDANDDIWILDLDRDVLKRFTRGNDSMHPVWTPDGTRLLFAAEFDGQKNIFWKRIDGSESRERLITSTHRQEPSSVSPNGKVVAFIDQDPSTDWDIWLLDLQTNGKPTVFYKTSFIEIQPIFYPKGDYIAFTSNESGRNEVYVKSYIGEGAKTQVSINGGNQPIWSRNGDALYYREGDKVMKVKVSTKPKFHTEIPFLLFEDTYDSWSINPQNYDVSSDGRFIMIKSKLGSSPIELCVVLNWFQKFKSKF